MCVFPHKVVSCTSVYKHLPVSEVVCSFLHRILKHVLLNFPMEVFFYLRHFKLSYLNDGMNTLSLFSSP